MSGSCHHRICPNPGASFRRVFHSSAGGDADNEGCTRHDQCPDPDCCESSGRCERSKGRRSHLSGSSGDRKSCSFAARERKAGSSIPRGRGSQGLDDGAECRASSTCRTEIWKAAARSENNRSESFHTASQQACSTHSSTASAGDQACRSIRKNSSGNP